MDKYTLQIGNVVQNWENISYIEELKKDFAVLRNGKVVAYDKLLPVTLTDKTFCGMTGICNKKDKSTSPRRQYYWFNVKNRGTILLMNCPDGGYYLDLKPPCLEDDFMAKYNCFVIKHIHELQNIFSGLTGEQLIIEI